MAALFAHGRRHPHRNETTEHNPNFHTRTHEGLRPSLSLPSRVRRALPTPRAARNKRHRSRHLATEPCRPPNRPPCGARPVVGQASNREPSRGMRPLHTGALGCKAGPHQERKLAAREAECRHYLGAHARTNGIVRERVSCACDATGCVCVSVNTLPDRARNTTICRSIALARVASRITTCDGDIICRRCRKAPRRPSTVTFNTEWARSICVETW